MHPAPLPVALVDQLTGKEHDADRAVEYIVRYDPMPGGNREKLVQV
jgi:hypothetical protein